MGHFSLLKLNNLPPEVRQQILSPEFSAARHEIQSRHQLTDEQSSALLDIVTGVIFQDIALPDLEENLAAELEIESPLPEQLALDIANEFLLPIASRYPDLSDYIKKITARAARATRQNASLTLDTPTNVSDLLKQHRDLAVLKITANPINSQALNKDVAPSLENWVKDYLYETGSQEHSSLERAEYMTKSSNVKQLSPEEKSLLSRFLRSYDEKVPLRLARKNNLLIILDPDTSARPSITDRPAPAPSPIPKTPIPTPPQPEIPKTPTTPEPPRPLIANLTPLEKAAIAKLNLNLTNPVLVARLNDLLAGFMRGARSRWKVIETLTKNESLGGLSLDTDQARKIISDLEKPTTPQPSTPVSSPVLAPKPAPIAPPTPVSSPASASSKPPEPSFSNTTDEIKLIDDFFTHQAASPPARARLPIPAAPAITPPSTATPPATPFASAPRKITDIQTPRHTVGPIEELRLLALNDLRQFPGGFPAALARIKEKIDLAATDHDPSKRIAAIRAWRDSAISRLYLRLGQESLLNGQNISQLISSRPQSPDSLSLEEFNALADFNQTLRN